MGFIHVLALAIVAVLTNGVAGHSFLSVPEPFSLIETCRVGGAPGFEAHCPGPCPQYDFREDKTPDMPSRTYKRGERVEIRWTKNNHLDGFMRISLVPIDEMWSHEAHSHYAFYYGCWSDNQFSCNEYERHRDCYYDLENLGYKSEITIPTIYPDGVYVFGYAWYGGGKVFGSFGDYYDCAYIEIKGGPREGNFPAAFESWDGSCMSSVGRLGICTTEPCSREHWSRRRIPDEFHNGTPMLEASWFERSMARPGNQISVSKHRDFGVRHFRIWNTNTDQEITLNQDWVIHLDWTDEITLTPATFGHITYVQWYVNGKFESDSRRYPWSISGSRRRGNGENFYKWRYHYFDKRVYVTAVVWNGNRRSYHSKDLVFMPRR